MRGGWDPTSYLAYADERSRPFFDLISRVRAEAPSTVVDLGCGPGQLTRALAERWRTAQVLGLDNSAAMIEAATEHAGDRVSFEVADIATWRPSTQVDVIVSNAALQWVPGHRDLLPGLVDALAPGGWLALQVPGNFEAPSHRLLHELVADPRFAAAHGAVERRPVVDAATYLADLTGTGCGVEAWETTYLHVLTGPDPVFRWISATGARPVLSALEGEVRETFEREYKALLREAYPPGDDGTVLPFRRVFAVAHKEARC